jgi:hypothetical protein
MGLLHGHIRDVHQLDIEYEVSLGGNSRMCCIGARAACGTVGKLPGNEQATLAADLHAIETLVPTRNYAAKTLGKSNGRACAHLGLAVSVHDGFAILVQLRGMVVKGGVEFAPVRG